MSTERDPVVVTNVAVVPKDGRYEDVLDWARSTLTYEDEGKQERKLYSEHSDHVAIPRGAWSTCPVDVASERQHVSAPCDMPEPLLPLRPYQTRPVDKLIKKGGGVLRAPTGSGKTVMSLHLAARLGQRTLILVHTKDLLAQWQESARNVLGIDVGQIGAGQWDEEGYPIVVAMVQTIMRYKALPPEWLDQWGCVILDEAHRAPASSFAHVMSQMVSEHLYGATATPTRRDGMHPVMHAIIGPVAASVNEDALVSSGRLLRPSVEMVATEFDSSAGRRMNACRNDFQRRALYQQVLAGLVDDVGRKELIARKVVEHRGGHQLVLSERIAYLEELEQLIYGLDPSIRSFTLTGRHSKDERRDVLRAMGSGDLDVLLATQLADEGLDLPILDTLHLTFPRKAIQKLQQQVGRVMRTAEGKRRCHVIDYVDVHVPVLRNQAKARYQWYVDTKGCDMTGWAPDSASQIKRRLARLRQEG